MILYYLTHVVSPPVLPNLQTIPNRGALSLEDLECEGCNIYFSRDANGWTSMNGESVGELIKGFFNFFAFEWHFKNNVISIRSPNGMLTKEAKGWTTLVPPSLSPFLLSLNLNLLLYHLG
jgi:terminal uridylyltransferase